MKNRSCGESPQLLLIMDIELANSRINVWPIAVLMLAVYGWSRWRKTHNLPYILSLMVFGIYTIFTLEATIFPILILGEYAEMMRENVSFLERINWKPFYFGEYGLTSSHNISIFKNIILTIPFGFGILFVTTWNRKVFIWLPWAVGVGFEACQFLISLALGYPYRVVDINDALFNAVGVIIGYGILKLMMWLFLKIYGRPDHQRNNLLGYFYNVAGRV